MKKTSKTRKLIYVSLGAVIMVLGAWITVPFAVPFTMQTFALYLLLHLFGGKIGFASVMVYIALGFLGLPVFSGFNSGISALIAPSGGFIIGFVAVGCLYLALESFLSSNSRSRKVLAFVSLLLCYGFGTAWYMFYFSVGAGFVTAISVCVLPYIIPDCVKLLLALAVSSRLKKLISV